MRKFVLLAATALAFTGAAQAEQYYKWRDANGALHYTQTPPPKGAQADTVAVSSRVPEPAAPAAPETAAAPGTAPAGGAAAPGQVSPEAQQQVAALRKQACENAKARAQQLANLPVVAMDINRDGKPVELNAQQHAAELDRANQAVATYCGAQ